MQPNKRHSDSAPDDRGELIEMILGLSEDQCNMVIERFQQALAQLQREAS